jgi:hypothetical protein
MSYGTYSIGFMLVFGGLIYGSPLMHVPAHWIVVGGIILLGIGILTGAKTTHQRIRRDSNSCAGVHSGIFHLIGGLADKMLPLREVGTRAALTADWFGERDCSHGSRPPLEG